MHNNTKWIFEKYAAEYFRPDLNVLEIGPDGFPSTFSKIVAGRFSKWDTLDVYDRPELTYRSTSEYDFAVPDNSYDIVMSANVIEHVRKVWRWMPELSRICKPGGIVITINPVSWPYHTAPIDCWRAFPEGMNALYEDSSLDVLVSTWETLEGTMWWRRLPGRSAKFQPRLLRYAYNVLGVVGFPVECAYDTITIGRKIDGARTITQGVTVKN